MSVMVVEPPVPLPPVFPLSPVDPLPPVLPLPPIEPLLDPPAPFFVVNLKFLNFRSGAPHGF